MALLAQNHFTPKSAAELSGTFWIPPVVGGYDSVYAFAYSVSAHRTRQPVRFSHPTHPQLGDVAIMGGWPDCPFLRCEWNLAGKRPALRRFYW